ncbi:tetraspanin-4-like [Ylistrum balloti]|uniref:tetraspanin-4-like n=1 Tax=Ylistrum balloti TaxID=509963 RepID=UPI002905A224|nr:tetraspanin-4-like [Ylistrum balloti]
MLKSKVPHLGLKEKARLFRRLMLAFLLVYLAEGFACLGISIWLLVRLHSVNECFLNYQINAASSLVLASGILTVCVCALGVSSTSKAKNSPTLRPFVIFFVVLVVLEISAAIVSAVDQNKLEDKTFHNSMSNTHWQISNEQDEDEQKELLECWKEIQVDFKCCGVDGYRDWITDPTDTYNFSVTISTMALDSCRCELNWRRHEQKCIQVNVTLGTNVSDYSVFTSPCYDALYSAINTQTTLLRWFCPILAIVQIVSFSFIFWLISKLQKANAIEIYGVDTGKNADGTEPSNIFSVSEDRGVSR